ncbi:uncharacterized protein LOC141598667 [Silene latifolia]|uniref:uncharacterized protein LOC141598667 n=1 Tax=Silene latifolia TaxID=37657 RepID=UPI003D7754B8
MVGYEPDLNPTIDWEKELRKLLRKDEPETSSASRFKPLIKPCQARKVEATREVEARNRGHLAMPMIQVFSVCIKADFDDGKPSEIYGSIRVLEESHPRFDLYNRDPEDSETIWKVGALSLIGPDGGAIVASLGTELDLCLYDRIRGVGVVNGKLKLDPMTEDSYDRLIKCDVEGAHGSASVYYVVFQFALHGSVQVIITKNDNDDKKCNAADIYGSVVVGYENARMYCSGDEYVKQLETRLFDKPSHQPMRVMAGIPIRLSRNVVAAPAYSTLTIKVNLWDSGDKIAGDCLQIPASLHEENSLFIRTQYACVEVRVRWHHAYIYLYRDRKMHNSNRVKSSKEREEVQKKSRVSHAYQHSASLVSRSVPSREEIIISNFGGLKVEVFTVFVSGITKKISALCGTIIVDDGSDRFSIYKRDESCSELLPDNGLACIEFNYRSIQNTEFCIILNLKDPVGNVQVSCGDLGWNAGTVESGMMWYNKRLCSVVRGKEGYAAVHYTIFDNAFEAFVEVKLFNNGQSDIPISLYGTLIARYSGHDYSTCYEKKYYVSRLYDRPRDKSIELKSGSGIELVKSIVVVPVRSSLIIEANLGAFGTENADKPICGIAEFTVDLSSVLAKKFQGQDLSGRISKEIQGDDFWIEVSAKFRKYAY